MEAAVVNKIITTPIDKNKEDIIRFNLYIFMMKLVGDKIYDSYLN